MPAFPLFALRLQEPNEDVLIVCQKQIADTQNMVEKSVKILHRFARALRPAVLDDLGLVPALRSYFKEFTEQTDIRVRFTHNLAAGKEDLDNIRRTVLYRVAQEALINVAKHADASLVTARIKKSRGSIHMDIKDNGVSFKVKRVLAEKMPQRR